MLMLKVGFYFGGGGGAVGSDYLIDSSVVDLQGLLIMNPVVQYCYWTKFQLFN